MSRVKHCFFGVALVVGVVTAVVAQDSPFVVDRDMDASPWTHLEFGNRPENFQFAIVTDRTGGHRPGVFRSGIERVNLLRPEFVMSVGDLIEGYSTDTAEISRQWLEFEHLIKPLAMPFFYVAGNHDVSNELMTEAWESRFGQAFYHFLYRDVLFLILNSEDGSSGNIGREQQSYIQKVVDRYPDVRWTLVFVHKPLWEFEPEQNGWSEIEQLLDGRRFTVFAGHRHRYLSDVRDGAQYVVLGTMGARSRRRGAAFGEFDHFMWVTMTDQGPVMANLALDGVHDSHVMTRRHRSLRRPVQAGAAVRSDGVVLDTEQFQGAKTVLRLTNDADLPMRVTLKVNETDVFEPSLTTLATTVGPNSVELVDLSISAKTAVPVSGLRPLVVDWTVRYDLEGELDPLQIQGAHRIVIDTPRMLPVAEGIRVDGVLDADEWGHLGLLNVEPGQVQAPTGGWFGPVDGSFRYRISRDRGTKYLHVAVDVVDDRLVVRSRRGFPRQDAVLVQFDGRPADDRRTGKGADSYSPFVLAVVPGEDGGVLAGDIPPMQILAAAQQTEQGYSVEMAIPIDTLIERAEGRLESFRVNVGINDTDGGVADRIWWRPEWGTPEEVTEAGVFRLQ